MGKLVNSTANLPTHQLTNLPIHQFTNSPIHQFTNSPTHQLTNCELPHMRPDPNVLLRTAPCADCGGMMLWTQNAWAHGNNRAAAYRCPNGHVIDPSLTRQCPRCG